MAIPARLSKKSIKFGANTGFNRVFSLLIGAGIFLLYIAVTAYFSTIEIDIHHDGIMLKPAMDVASGRMLFRDTFSQYGALTTIIQAVSLNIFGKYLLTLKYTTVFFYGLISILLYLILKKILPKPMVFACLAAWALLAPYYIGVLLIWSSVYALFFQLLAAWLLLISFEKKSGRLVFFGGACTALVFWCRQPVGISMFLAVIAFYIFSCAMKMIDTKELKKSLFNYVAGNILIFALFIVWLAANHALIDWWKQSILYPFIWSKSVGAGLTNIMRVPFPGSISPLIPIWSLLPIATIWVLIRNSKNRIIGFLAFIGLASWVQYYPVVNSLAHLYWAGTPMLGLCALFFYQTANDILAVRYKIPENVIKYLSVIAFIIIFLPDVSHRINKGLEKINKRYYSIEHPAVLKGMRLTGEEVDLYTKAYGKIEKYFIDNPGGNVVTTGRDALYLTFDARIRNFNPVYVNWPQVNATIYRDYPAKLEQYIEANRPLEI